MFYYRKSLEDKHTRNFSTAKVQTSFEVKLLCRVCWLTFSSQKHYYFFIEHEFLSREPSYKFITKQRNRGYYYLPV